MNNCTGYNEAGTKRGFGLDSFDDITSEITVKGDIEAIGTGNVIGKNIVAKGATDANRLNITVNETDGHTKISHTSSGVNYQTWIETKATGDSSFMVGQRVENTTNGSRWGTWPYDLTKPPVAVFVTTNYSTLNYLKIGGGSGSMQAVTSIYLYAANSIDGGGGSAIFSANYSGPTAHKHLSIASGQHIRGSGENGGIEFGGAGLISIDSGNLLMGGTNYDAFMHTPFGMEFMVDDNNTGAESFRWATGSTTYGSGTELMSLNTDGLTIPTGKAYSVGADDGMDTTFTVSNGTVFTVKGGLIVSSFTPA